MSSIKQLLEMIRFSHTLFALPFALLASVMAGTARTPGGEVVQFPPLPGVVAAYGQGGDQIAGRLALVASIGLHPR